MTNIELTQKMVQYVGRSERQMLRQLVRKILRIAGNQTRIKQAMRRKRGAVCVVFFLPRTEEIPPTVETKLTTYKHRQNGIHTSSDANSGTTNATDKTIHDASDAHDGINKEVAHQVPVGIHDKKDPDEISGEPDGSTEKETSPVLTMENPKAAVEEELATKLPRSNTVYDRNSCRKHRPVLQGDHDMYKWESTSPDAVKYVADSSTKSIEGKCQYRETDPPGGELSTNPGAAKQITEHTWEQEKTYDKAPKSLSMMNGTSSDLVKAKHPMDNYTSSTSSSDGCLEAYDCTCFDVGGYGLHKIRVDNQAHVVKYCNGEEHHACGMHIKHNSDPIKDAEYTVDSGPEGSLTEFAAGDDSLHVTMDDDPFCTHEEHDCSVDPHPKCTDEGCFPTHHYPTTDSHCGFRTVKCSCGRGVGYEHTRAAFNGDTHLRYQPAGQDDHATGNAHDGAINMESLLSPCDTYASNKFTRRDRRVKPPRSGGRYVNNTKHGGNTQMLHESSRKTQKKCTERVTHTQVASVTCGQKVCSPGDFEENREGRGVREQVDEIYEV